MTTTNDAPTVTIDYYGEQRALTPVFGRYGAGERLCVEMSDALTGSPMYVLTVNLPDAPNVETALFGGVSVYVKGWGPNEDLVDALVAAGWLVPTNLVVPTGYVEARVMVLSGALGEAAARFIAEESA